MKIQPQYHPLVSVIVPVRNGSRTLGACLRSIKRSYYQDTEIIVVDDHSTDDSAEIAEALHCTVVTPADGKGANNARNTGARCAKGEVLMFVDSDIVLGRETILAVMETLEEESIHAVVGLYTAKHRNESFASQYKNLWVRYSYIKSPPTIDWLFGSISAIKRGAFEQLGGFDVDLLARHGHDDIELGKRAARAKLNIVLNMDIEVEHLKQYTLASFMQNEFDRSAGFAELAVRFGETAQSFSRGFVNVYPVFIFSTIFSVLVLLTMLASASTLLPDWCTIVMAGFYLLVNLRFLNYLEQVRGLFAMVVMIPYLFLDHLVCFAGSIVGTARGFRKKNQ